MTKKQEAQRLFRVFKDETKNSEPDSLEFAKWMRDRDWPLPIPQDPLVPLGETVEGRHLQGIRRDKTTGQPYKANLTFSGEGGQGTFWKLVDVDEAPRKTVVKCLNERREQTVCDVYQMELIADHWSNTHPDEEPIIKRTTARTSSGRRTARAQTRPSLFSTSQRRQSARSTLPRFSSW